MDDLRKLAEPFPASDIEWRIQQAGLKDGKPWGLCLAYVTNRAIQQRLDDVVGPAFWRNEFKFGPEGAVLCGISIYLGGELGWVTKWDGATNTDMEAVKGGLSGSQKRAGVQWGIGRYLYHLPEGWAVFHDEGSERAKIKANPNDKNDRGKWYRWSPPSLPSWALPGGSGNPARRAASQGEDSPPPQLRLVPSEPQAPAQAQAQEPPRERTPEAMLQRLRTLLEQLPAGVAWRLGAIETKDLGRYLRKQWPMLEATPAMAQVAVDALEAAVATTQMPDEPPPYDDEPPPPVGEQQAPFQPAVPDCPKCGGPMWDNRGSKRSPNAPDFKCKSSSCKDAKGFVTGLWEKDLEQPELQSVEAGAGANGNGQAPRPRSYDDAPPPFPYEDDLPF